MKKMVFTFTAAIILSASPAFADSKASHHSGQASKHSALAVSHGAASTASAASAVVAVPLIVVGGSAVVIGSAALEAGETMLDASVSHNQRHAPLVITETIITADPAPNQVIVIQNNITTDKQ